MSFTCTHAQHATPKVGYPSWQSDHILNLLANRRLPSDGVAGDGVEAAVVGVVAGDGEAAVVVARVVGSASS